MLDTYNDLLTKEEVCEVLYISESTLYRLLNSGQLEAFRCGRIWKIPKAGVVNYIMSNMQRGVGR